MYYVSRTQFPFFPLVREKYKTLERIPLLLFRYFLTLPRKFRDNYVVFPFVSFSRNLSNRFPEGSSRRQRRWQTGAVQPNHQHSPHRSWSTQQTELLQNLIMKYIANRRRMRKRYQDYHQPPEKTGPQSKKRNRRATLPRNVKQKTT